MFTSNFKNKKNLNILFYFFAICLMFLAFIVSVPISAEKKDFKALVDARAIKISPIEHKVFDGKSTPNTYTIKSDQIDAIKSLLKTEFDQIDGIKDNYDLSVEIAEGDAAGVLKVTDGTIKDLKIVAKVKEDKKTLFLEGDDAKTAFTFSNDLTKLRVPTTSTDKKTVLAFADFEILEKGLLEDLESTESQKRKANQTHNNKYKEIVKTIIQDINKLNPFTKLDDQEFKNFTIITVNNNGVKQVKLSGKTQGKADDKSEFLNFRGEKTIDLNVSPALQDAETFIKAKNNNSLYIGPIKKETTDANATLTTEAQKEKIKTYLITKILPTKDNQDKLLAITKDDYGITFDDTNKKVKIKLLNTGKKTTILSANNDLVELSFDNDLERLKLLDNFEIDTKKYEEINNKSIKKSAKYEFIFQNIKELNPFTELLASDFDVDFDSSTKNVILKGKNTGTPENKSYKLINSKMTTLKVKVVDEDSTKSSQSKNNNRDDRQNQNTSGENQQSLQKTDLKKLIENKNHNSLTVGPVRFEAWDVSTDQQTVKNDQFSSVITNNIPAALSGKVEIGDWNYRLKTFKLKVKTENQSDFVQNELQLTFSNNLNDIFLPSSTTKITLTEEQFNTMKNSNNSDPNKYKLIVDFIKTHNPMILLESKDLEIKFSETKQDLILSGKTIDIDGNRTGLNFSNTKVIPLEVTETKTKTNQEQKTTTQDQTTATTQDQGISWWIYVITIVFVVTIGFIAFKIFKNKNRQ
ncbi:hypothetical protein ATP_00481 [Candidatus Phytoplasma mali]|uniref:Uncharacterized protein n=1 Tax=Phytoplasma mali (strain AT) TaxID=482235 RepID=B3R040_PHYMT|nr:hypothetical protein [Candidatus Phytoplasma mali]CAP18204.1 hypothetical protein ATP_00017 [Candidatus Phytoplasma mali]CAP18668.1 hypothetical protein ATP_00481 [Candidatus Phytoplasma mali]